MCYAEDSDANRFEVRSAQETGATADASTKPLEISDRAAYPRDPSFMLLQQKQLSRGQAMKTMPSARMLDARMLDASDATPLEADRRRR